MLISPHGGVLVDLRVDAARAAELHVESRDWRSWDLTSRQLADLELLVTGALSPLTGFMTRADYESVCADMRAASGLLWPLPIVLDVPCAFADELAGGTPVALRDPSGVLLAVLHVDDIWRPDLRVETEILYGDAVDLHARHLMERDAVAYVGGRVEALRLPPRYGLDDLRVAPAEMRRAFTAAGWRSVMAVQPAGALHRADVERLRRVMHQEQAAVLIHPSISDVHEEALAFLRCCRAVLPRLPHGMAKLAVLPLARRAAGARETMLQALVRRNYGCSHYVTDEGVPPAPAWVDFERDSGVRVIPRSPGDQVRMSPAVVRRALETGHSLPEDFSYPEVLEELQRHTRRRHEQGVAVFLTGLSGSGKSTIANLLRVRLLESWRRAVTFLDGDLVRKHLSSRLGFSREDRNLNVRRIGFVAAEIVRHGGVVICAPIAPYETVRNEVRTMVEAVGGFVLVHVATPLDICERRDPKGLYARARAGLIVNFTGVDDPYEPPEDPEVRLDSAVVTPEAGVDAILEYLVREGYLGGAPADKGSSTR